MDRRELLAAGVATLSGLLALPLLASVLARPRTGGQKRPLIHVTDLYHPPQDPDDHFDLATILGLEEYDLKGVILDATERFLNPSPAGSDIARDPGFIPVIQMAFLLGRDIPVAAGPRYPLKSVDDDVSDRPLREQAGIRLLLDILEDSPSKVIISVVGSSRVVAAAYNRNPSLLHAKVGSILLNAGSLGGPKREWNVGLDTEAYIRLWRSGLPIHWFPCATERSAFDQNHERGTYWKATQAELLRSVTPTLRSWFAYALTASTRNDVIRVLSEEPAQETWDRILAQERNLWSTASLAMGASRVLAKTREGWRFMPADARHNEETWPWRLDPVHATVNDQAEVHWNIADNGRGPFLFGRKGGREFGAAMAEALGALLAGIG
jgi:pyrimidine-specific ribonucleoside hydrolase